MVILDTNIIIGALRQKKGDTFFQKIIEKVGKDNVGLSVISIQELYQGKSVLEAEKEKDLMIAISLCKQLPYTFQIAARAGKIVSASDYKIQFADAAIASTVLENGAQLATLNIKDFEGISGLELHKIQ